MIENLSTIYHYCSIDSFLKIAMSQTLWFSHTQTTNDLLEDRVFLKDVKKVSQELSDEMPEFKELLTRIANNYIKKVDFPYICSFSREKDMLSQWRAYGDNGEGVCIGFDLSKFDYVDLVQRNHGHDSPIICIDEVGYRDNHTDGIKNDFLAAALLRTEYQLTDLKIEQTLSRWLDLLSIFTKSDAFREESEVRMVYFPSYCKMLSSLTKIEPSEVSCPPLRFRAKGSAIVSYFEFPLPEESICELVLGPKCKTEDNQLTLFLSQVAPQVRINNRISRSKITYR